MRRGHFPAAVVRAVTIFSINLQGFEICVAEHQGRWHAAAFESHHLTKHCILFLNSFMRLTATSISSRGHSLNSFVLVEASLLAQEFCLNSASKTCQWQIRTRNSNLCFKGTYGSKRKYFYLPFFPQKCQIKESIITIYFQEMSSYIDFRGQVVDGVNLRKVSEMHRGLLFMANVTWRINYLSKKTEIFELPAALLQDVWAQT